ncbi:TPA: hypothetical protein ACHV3Y_001194 [Klebsiella variicola]
MTKSTITDKRVTSVIERLEHYACNLKWTNVRGAQDLLAAADGLRELQERRKAAMDSEPVERVNADQMHHVCLEANRHLDKYGAMAKEVNKLLGCIPAQPAPEYPEVLPCSVLLEPGLRFGKGIKTSTMLAALARRAVHESDLAALSPEERAEFQARIEDFKALIAQPVPVVSADLLHTAASAIEDLLTNKDRTGAGVWFDLPFKLRSAANAQLSPVVPDDVLEALQKVARIRLDLDEFDGDRLGIADCLCDAEEALIEVVNRRAAMLHAGNSPANPDCWCRTCRPVVLNDMRFVVCPDCGNKRCPRANDHRNACTGSNEPSQEGSAYPDTPREVKS